MCNFLRIATITVSGEHVLLWRHRLQAYVSHSAFRRVPTRFPCCLCCRPANVEQLGRAREDRGAAVNANGSAKLKCILADLNNLAYSPDELKQAKGIGAPTRASAVNNLEDVSVKSAIIALRTRWNTTRKLECEFSVLAAQLWMQPGRPTAPIAFIAVSRMFDMGFRSVFELDGVNVSSWPIHSACARLYLDSLCDPWSSRPS